jgi:hypothetical protein
MNIVEQNQTPILLRLRVKGTKLERGQALSNMQRLLGGLNWQPLGMPPSAIVFIRKLPDPLPQSLRPSARYLQPSLAWQQAFNTAVDQLVRRAHRPIFGWVPADAQAVIFFDRSELLACLAIDWRDGSLLAHWWWQSLVQLVEVRQVIMREWLRLPQYIPTALERLAQKSEVEPFIRNLTDAEAAAILHSLVSTFGLVDIQNLIETLQQGKEIVQHADLTAAKKLPHDAGQLPAQSKGFRDWRIAVQEDRRGFSVEQRLLCIVGLTLARLPVVARSQTFAKALADNLGDNQTQESGTKFGATPVTSTPRKSTGESLNHNPEMQTATLLTESTTRSAKRQREVTKRGASNESHHLTGANRAIEKSQDVAIAPPDERNQQANLAARDGDLPVNSEKFFSSETAVNRSTIETAANQTVNQTSELLGEETFFQADIETSLGGTFYLINLALFLNLYSDFTSPMRPGIALSIWDFLALVGQKICRTQFENDALWALLAKLAGRSEGDHPGKDFMLPDEWRIPVEWLKPFSHDRVCYWQISGNRLRVVHTQGFVILDVPLAGASPTAQLMHELQPYDHLVQFELQPSLISDDIENLSPLESWLAWLVPYLQARLAYALGVKVESECAKILLQHQARAQVTPVRVDVFFDLNQLPIEVRLSGLDRNPGWVPAAGRFIEFHFD